MLKQPDDNDVKVATDASRTEGACGIWFEKNQAFQVRWCNTIYYEVLKQRPELKIHAQELMGTWIAADLWGSQWEGQAVTLYNDNPSAAAGIISKHLNYIEVIYNVLFVIYVKKQLTNDLCFRESRLMEK